MIVTNLPDIIIEKVPPPIYLPSFPVLTTLVIYLLTEELLPRLTNILCSIDSTPVLTSIAIDYADWRTIDYLPMEGRWVDVDRWLLRIVKRAEVTGGLSLTLS